MATDRRQVHYRKPINRKSVGARTGAESARVAENPQTVDDFRLTSGRYSAERYRQTSGRSAIEAPGEAASGYAADMTRDKLYRDTATRLKKEQ